MEPNQLPAEPSLREISSQISEIQNLVCSSYLYPTTLVSPHNLAFHKIPGLLPIQYTSEYYSFLVPI